MIRWACQGCFIFSLTLVACSSDKKEETATATPTPTTYAALQSVISSKCISCHTASTWTQSETTLRATTEVKTKVAAGDMPPSTSGITLTSDEKSKFANF